MKVKTLLSGPGIAVVICLALLNGCATTNTVPKTAGKTTPLPNEELKEIKVTEFIIGVGDTVEIAVYRHDDLKKTIQIDTSGKITYPLIGDIQAAELSIFQLRDRIRDGLSKYVVNPQVSVGVTAVQSQKVIVLGEVKNPGLFSLGIPMNTLEAISRAGGFTTEAKQKSVLLIRGGLDNPELITLNIERFFSKHDLTQNIYLQNGDIIYVPATFIVNVARFFQHLSTIISPIVSTGTGYLIGQQIEEGSQEATITVSTP